MSDIKPIQDHITIVKPLLAWQKLVENLRHLQHHDLAEYLIHKQNLGRLDKMLDRLEILGSFRMELLSEPSPKAST
jgi:hypothetical protein